MRPAPFEYLAPRTKHEAVDLMTGTDGSVLPLAGGQSLVALLNARAIRPRIVLDLNRVPGLDGIEVTASSVRVGAMTRTRTIESSGPLREALPILPAAAARVATVQIRYRSTVGGSLCHADPAAHLPTVAVALGADLLLLSSTGVRTVPAEEFFVDEFRTARRPDELLTDIEFPRLPGLTYRFTEVTRRGHLGFPLVGLCAGFEIQGGRFTAVRMAASGVGPQPLRLRAAEQMLLSCRVTADPAAVAEKAVACTAPRTDLHGDAGYRRDLLRILICRTLNDAAAKRNRDD